MLFLKQNRQTQQSRKQVSRRLSKKESQTLTRRFDVNLQAKQCRTDLVSFFYEQKIMLDTTQTDREFLIKMPKIQFLPNGELECGDDSEDE